MARDELEEENNLKKLTKIKKKKQK